MTHTAIIKKFSIVALVFVIFCTVAPPAHAADPLSVTLSPAAAVNIGTTGTGWSASTVARALLVDGSETNLTNALPANGASMLLVLTGFNFDIPAGATIAGIAVSVTRRSTSSSGAFVRDAAIELVGGFGTSSSLAAADAWPATLAAAAYGGPSALWGASFTPADVNAHVDGATVTVYYYEADTTPPSIAAAPDLPGNEATSSAGAVVTFSLPSASDEGGIASESCNPASGSTFALGSTTVTCTAVDPAGNSASAHFDIGVVERPVAEIVDAVEPKSQEGQEENAAQASGNVGSGSNGAPVGLFGIVNTIVPVGNAEQTAGNAGIGTGGEVLGAQTYRFTEAQINALLEFLRAFGVDSALVDALGKALRITATSTTP